LKYLANCPLEFVRQPRPSEIESTKSIHVQKFIKRISL
jgi:hypothetical protein